MKKSTREIVRRTGGRDTLKNYFLIESANPNGVEQISFADGTVWDFGAVKGLLPVVTTDGNDTIYAYDSAEVIDAGLGNDTVYARGGDDVVSGARMMRSKTNGATCAVLFWRSKCKTANDALYEIERSAA